MPPDIFGKEMAFLVSGKMVCIFYIIICIDTFNKIGKCPDWMLLEMMRVFFAVVTKI